MAVGVPIRIPLAGGDGVDGDLAVTPASTGLVVFAHGSGSSRHSSRNQAVAAGLQERGLSTLLMDLLTAAEEDVDLRTRQHRFDIELLARRLEAAVAWLGEQANTKHLPLGYFGASTGAAAGLVAAARSPEQVAAVVSRGGRADLAGPHLEQVQAPTLLIVGGDDDVVLDLNRDALARLRVERKLEIIPGATHLFEEPGALDEVTRLAGDWFVAHVA